MSPRRSSRARTSQPTPSGPQHSHSTASSITSDRASQSVGLDQKPLSRSPSSEDINATQTRRTRRSQDIVKDETVNPDDKEEGVDGDGDVRCICGNVDYPGLVESNSDLIKSGSKNDLASAAASEDGTGWFIQCDDCQVWQHGRCVGIMDEATNPDGYFCEQCRKDLHKVATTANGRKHSIYLPAQNSKSSNSSPASAPKKLSKRSRNTKAAQLNAELTSKGRRSTMNSRDAAYEEEQLALAIEQSKQEGDPTHTIPDVRKGKRSRSDSEERTEDTKRQRTTSGSASSGTQSKSRRRDSNSDEESEKMERPKAIRGAAARNQKNKEARDREAQREKERAEIGRRKGRAERDEDSRSITPEPRPRIAGARGSKANAPSLPTPERNPPKATQKKTGRPPARKGRIGRNQYTRDRDPPSHNDINHHKSSPAPSDSSPNAEGGTPHANGYSNGDSRAVRKLLRSRNTHPNRTTMNEMKRRVAAILEFISHTQVDMAGSASALTTKSSTSTNTPPHDKKVEELSGKAVNAALMDVDVIDEKAFATLSSLEMMEVLTRRLMKWQSEYGKWGEK
ncbi:Histone deacetylase complex subunit [Lecanora helva]